MRRGLTPLLRCSRFILQPQPTGQKLLKGCLATLQHYLIIISLTGTNTPGQSRLESNCNESLLHIWNNLALTKIIFEIWLFLLVVCRKLARDCFNNTHNLSPIISFQVFQAILTSSNIDSFEATSKMRFLLLGFFSVLEPQALFNYLTTLFIPRHTREQWKVYAKPACCGFDKFKAEIKHIVSLIIVHNFKKKLFYLKYFIFKKSIYILII